MTLTEVSLHQIIMCVREVTFTEVSLHQYLHSWFWETTRVTAGYVDVSSCLADDVQYYPSLAITHHKQFEAKMMTFWWDVHKIDVIHQSPLSERTERSTELDTKRIKHFPDFPVVECCWWESLVFCVSTWSGFLPVIYTIFPIYTINEALNDIMKLILLYIYTVYMKYTYQIYIKDNF